MRLLSSAAFPKAVPSAAAYLVAFAALVLVHGPLLELPYHWDELGQFIPAALDLYEAGAWIPVSTNPNVHPPALMALLAAVWSLAGYSILASRLTMLAISAASLVWAAKLCRKLIQDTALKVAGPKFRYRLDPRDPIAAVLLLLFLTPLFYTQSMMALLDLPAMALTAAVLVLFFDARYRAAALVSVLLVLVKETAITTPMVLAGWLLLDRQQRGSQAMWFFAPAVALSAWLFYLHAETGYWLGNPGFEAYNVDHALTPSHIANGIERRVYFLFFADGRWIGLIFLLAGWRNLLSRRWAIAGSVAIVQVAAVTVLGGALLERYLLPAVPILYAAMAVAALRFTPPLRWTLQTAMAALLFVGWFLPPPFSMPLENNLAMVDFVRLQQQAAQELQRNPPAGRIVTDWPFYTALRIPELGYVDQPLTIESRDAVAEGLVPAPNSEDIVAAWPLTWPYEASWFKAAPLALSGAAPSPTMLRERADVSPDWEEMARWSRGGQAIGIYRPAE